MFGLHGLGWGFPGCSAVKNLPVNGGDAGDVDLIPGSGKSPEGEMAYPLQYSSLGNPTDRAASGYSPWRYKQSDTIEHTHTYTYMHTYTRVHTRAHINTCTRMCAHTYAHARTYTCVRVHTYTHAHTYTHKHMHTHAHTQTYTHTHRLGSPAVTRQRCGIRRKGTTARNTQSWLYTH